MIFGIIGNIEKKEIGTVLVSIIEYLIKTSASYILDEKLMLHAGTPDINDNLGLYFPKDEVIDKSDIIIALGGDGTILSTARQIGAKQKPIVGVNLGKLGFLAQIGKQEIFHFIDDIIVGNYTIEKRAVIEAKIIDGDTNHLFGLNDIVIEKSRTSRMISIEAHVNKDYLITFMADGLIASTPTGSTAYSLASNGPIVVPSSEVIIINPICPHTLTVRPIIIPNSFIFRAFVNSENKEAMIIADGQIEVNMKTPFEIIIKKAKHEINLVKRSDVSYFDLLRSKLMWGKDMRTEK